MYRVLLVQCHFSRGGFPSEMVFHIGLDCGHELTGVSSKEYCFDEEKNSIKTELKPGEQVAGYIVGILLGEGKGKDTSCVNLPDCENYDIPN